MFEGRLLQPECDFKTLHPIARIEILNGNFREFYDIADKEKLFDIQIQRHRTRRSLRANSYFHVLCDMIAEKLGTSKAEVKNLMICRYGQADRLADGSLNTMTIRDEVDVGQFEELHLRPTANTEVKNGKLYRQYIVMRGTGWGKRFNGYDTYEMAKLIEGTIEEAKQIGLTDAEIMTPKEKQILREVYGIGAEDDQRSV